MEKPMKAVSVKLRLAALAILSAACRAPVGPAGAQPAFPPPPPEAGPMPPPPGPAAGFVLEPGHWQWNGARYVWVGRHWIAARAGYVHFVPGHWNRFGRWIPAHWGS